MWKISKLEHKKDAHIHASFSDGYALNDVRGELGNCYRLMVYEFGYLDIIDTGHQPGGPRYSQLIISDQLFWYDNEGELEISVNPNGSFEVAGNGNLLFGKFSPFPAVEKSDAANLQWMSNNKLISLSANDDSLAETVERLKSIGKKYFPFSPYSFELAMAVYDWSTSGRIRMNLLKLYEQGVQAGARLNTKAIAKSIWKTSNTFQLYAKKQLEQAFMLKSSASKKDIEFQLNQVGHRLFDLNKSEVDLLLAALAVLPPTTSLNNPVLYKTLSLSNPLDIRQFNKKLKLKDAGVLGDSNSAFDFIKNNVFKVGARLHLHGWIGCADGLDVALKRKGEIVLAISPPLDTLVWNDSKRMNELMSEDEHDYLLKDGTGFIVEDISQINHLGQDLIKVNLRIK